MNKNVMKNNFIYQYNEVLERQIYGELIPQYSP